MLKIPKVVLILAVLAVFVPQQAVSAAVPINGGVYQLAVASNGMCVDVVAGSRDNGALLQQWGCTAGAAWQQFRVVSAGSGRFNLVNVQSGRCVDVPSGSTAPGVRLQQWGCGDGMKPNQQWTFAASGSGTYQIVGVNGLCIAASGAATVQEACSANTNKQWAFNPVGSTAPPTVASDGTGQYRTVQAAIDAVPANNTTRRVITIKAGTYREIVTVPADRPLITLQGLGTSPGATVIVNNHSSAGGYGTSGSATVFAHGRDFTATNLTIANDYGEGSQAVALNLNADRAVLTNVRLLGNQDTLLVNDGARAYVRNSYVEGTVDFIFGGGTIVFHGCQIYQRRTSGGPITAASTAATKTYGMLFHQSTVTGAANNVTQLGRPWRPDAQVLYRESSLSATISTAQPWVDMSGNSWRNARFLEYRNTGAGAPINGNRPQLADAQAANYTPQRYLAGADGWNPIS